MKWDQGLYLTEKDGKEEKSWEKTRKTEKRLKCRKLHGMEHNLFQPGFIIHSNWAPNLTMTFFHIQIWLWERERKRECVKEKIHRAWITLFSYGYSADSRKNWLKNVRGQIFGHPWCLFFVQSSVCLCESVRLTVNNGFFRLIFHCLNRVGGNKTNHDRFGLVSN